MNITQVYRRKSVLKSISLPHAWILPVNYYKHIKKDVLFHSLVNETIFCFCDLEMLDAILLQANYLVLALSSCTVCVTLGIPEHVALFRLQGPALSAARNYFFVDSMLLLCSCDTLTHSGTWYGFVASRLHLTASTEAHCTHSRLHTFCTYIYIYVRKHTSWAVQLLLWPLSLILLR